MTRRVTTRSRGAGLYDILVDGQNAGDLYQDHLTPTSPWRFSPSGNVRFAWWSVCGPYRTKRDALDRIRLAVDTYEHDTKQPAVR